MDLPEQLYQAMVGHAGFAHPNEACGLLAADRTGRLRMAYCLTNVDDSASRYTVDPVEHYGALRHADRNGWDIVGVYHSHPSSPAYPSRRDVAHALDPEWLYLIVGPGPAVRAFRIRSGRVAEERLTVRPRPSP